MLRNGITARRYLRDGPRLPEIRVSVLSFLLHTHDVGCAEVFVERTGPRLGLRLISLVLARLRTHPGRGMREYWAAVTSLEFPKSLVGPGDSTAPAIGAGVIERLSPGTCALFFWVWGSPSSHGVGSS